MMSTVIERATALVASQLADGKEGEAADLEAEIERLREQEAALQALTLTLALSLSLSLSPSLSKKRRCRRVTRQRWWRKRTG